MKKILMAIALVVMLSTTAWADDYITNRAHGLFTTFLDGLGVLAMSFDYDTQSILAYVTDGEGNAVPIYGLGAEPYCYLQVIDADLFGYPCYGGEGNGTYLGKL